jgi:hypothetical protein
LPLWNNVLARESKLRLETSGDVCRGSPYFLFYFPSILKKYAIYGFEHTCNKGVREFQWKSTVSKNRKD